MPEIREEIYKTLIVTGLFTILNNAAPISSLLKQMID